MKSARNWGLVGASAVMAIVAAVASHFYLSNKEQEIRNSLIGTDERVSIVVPRQSLMPGDVVRMEMVAARPISKDLVPAGAISPDEFPAVAGLVVKQEIPQGTPLLKHLLIGANADDAFSMLLKEGERAMTFEVDEKNSNSHLLRPGDFVDVVLSEKGKDGGEDKVTNTQASVVLKQSARVLAAGARSVSSVSDMGLRGEAIDSWDYQTITLAVQVSELSTFLQATKMVEGGDSKLQFLLRNPSDKKKVRLFNRDSVDYVEMLSGGNTSDGELKVRLGSAMSLNSSQGRDERLYKKYDGEGLDTKGNSDVAVAGK